MGILRGANIKKNVKVVMDLTVFAIIFLERIPSGKTYGVYENRC